MAPFPANVLRPIFMLLATSFSFHGGDAFQQDHGGYRQAASKYDAKEAPMDQRRPLNTVSVTCHPDSLEILIQADLFGVGAPVYSFELHLGVDHGEDFCQAVPFSEGQYRILVRLLDCGTKYWMTEDSLVYTNLLIYSPAPSPDGLIRMDEAVIPIECHYDRRYSLSSSSLAPTWIPFMSTQAAVETLDFKLRVMTNDWLYERSSNVYYVGQPISMEASVRVGHHMGLRVFLSSCVATLQPDIHSVPRYVFIEHGCLLDSKLPGSKSHFLVRTQDDKLQLVIDAFRFHNEDRGELYITCHMNAVPVNDAEVPNKACTFVNGRWRSADGNDYLCGYCQSQSEVGQAPRKPAKFGPRGFSKLDVSEPQWRSRLPADVWEEEQRVGPVLVLPSKKSWTLSEEELPPVLEKISRPALYGSQWKSGLSYRKDLKKGLLPGLFTSNQDEDLTFDDDEDIPLEEFPSELKDDKDESGPVEPTLIPEVGQEDNSTLGTDHWPVAQSEDVTILSNSTDAPSVINDPKK
uniref:zona pellucida sperm-binding protein 3-like n=1 Tax=Doryrhamphus excisus TaxID=161450 RepID=UPI0025AE33B9|nr:zona pellucida sperm-binding protein 3-like [Doryrhamphus excisus]